ncbi:IWS1-like protein [Hyalella azteca]|uniref:IWS1-like protein n=1 Tax=Hyalella azteca TaxID=294128 RepID=A0A979FVN5_HYAAZ|nr:IWS1-like protein [Hyalella azteca]
MSNPASPQPAMDGEPEYLDASAPSVSANGSAESAGSENSSLGSHKSRRDQFEHDKANMNAASSVNGSAAKPVCVGPPSGPCSPTESNAEPKSSAANSNRDSVSPACSRSGSRSRTGSEIVSKSPEHHARSPVHSRSRSPAQSQSSTSPDTSRRFRSPAAASSPSAQPKSRSASASPNARIRSRSQSGSPHARHQSGSPQSRRQSGSPHSRRQSGSPHSRRHPRSRSRSGSPRSRSRSGSPRSRSRSGSPRSRSQSGSPRPRSRSGSLRSRSRSGSPHSRSRSGSPRSRSRSGSPRSRSRSGSPQSRQSSSRSRRPSSRKRSRGPSSSRSRSRSGSPGSSRNKRRNQVLSDSDSGDESRPSKKPNASKSRKRSRSGSRSGSDEGFPGPKRPHAISNSDEEVEEAPQNESENGHAINVQTEEATKAADSSDDEGVRDSNDQAEFVNDFDAMMARKKELMGGRRRKMNVDIINDNEELISVLVSKMRIAADQDRQLNLQHKPATNKMALLDLAMRQISKTDLIEGFLDANVLTALTDWLAPMPDHSLPSAPIRHSIIKWLSNLPPLSQEMLKTSGIGKAIMYLFRHPRESRINRERCGRLISKWARPIFNNSDDFKSLTKEERLERDLEMKETGRLLSRKQEPVLDENNSKILRPGDPGWCYRARVPQASGSDYVVRPKSTVEGEVRKNVKAKKSRLDKQRLLFQQKKSLGKVKRAVAMSMEGRNMPL